MDEQKNEIESLQNLLIATQEKIEEQEKIFFRKGYIQACRDLNLKLSMNIHDLIDDIQMSGLSDMFQKNKG